MSVKVCPECGSEYLPNVYACVDDGAVLVVSDTDEMAAEVDEQAALADDRELAGLTSDELADESEGDQIAYELAAWDNESRVHLDRLLVGENVLHVWEAATLVIRSEDEERVDLLVEQVSSTDLPTLDADKEQVGYELEDWTDEMLLALTESLAEQQIPYGFDEEDDLVVHEEDEERVEAILDQVDFNFSVDGDDIAAGGDGDGDPSNDDDDSGLVAQEVLTELFVAADRLQHDARDSAGVVGLDAATVRVKELTLPYGFAPGVWQDIVGQSVALHAMFQGSGEDADDDTDESDDGETSEGTDDDRIMGAAKELRALLHQYV